MQQLTQVAVLAILLASSNAFVRVPLQRVQRQEAIQSRNRDNVALQPQGLGDTYMMTIEIGTPGQKLNVLLDTGSSDLWVPSAYLCTNYFINLGTGYCSYHNGFDKNESSTYKTIIPPSLPSERVFSKDYGMDFVNIHGLNPIIVKFGMANDYILTRNNADGILGLAYTGLSEFQNKISFSNHIEQPLFSFYFTSTGGEVTFGGVDNSRYKGNITYLPIAAPADFSITIEGFSVGEQTLDQYAGVLIPVDTGTNQIVVPQVVLQFIKDLGYPTISFIFDGEIFTLESYYYFDNNGLPLISAGKNNTWVLGTPFMTKYYTVFDMENFQVGFGRAV